MEPEFRVRPEPPRSSGPWPAVAFGLAALLTVLIVATVAFYPGLVGRQPSPTGSGVAVSPSGFASVSPSVSPSFVRPTLSPSPSFMTYVVARGDSLTSIARRFDTTPRSIAWWNREAYPTLDPLSEDYQPNRIQVGWMLALIPGTVFDESDLPTPSPPPTASPTPGLSPAPTASPAGP